MFDSVLAILCLISVFLIVYHHAIYPLILRQIGRKAALENPVDEDDNTHFSLQDEELPSITLIIPAYNEKKYIADKIRNISALDYPADKLLVRVLGDGCTDNTYDIACETAQEPECQHLNIRVEGFSTNRGKVALLNEALLHADSDIVAFSDVSALVSIDALRVLAARFGDPEVGVVSSNYQLLNPGSEGEQSYWSYQRKIKQNESALAGLLGAHGAFYAFRRELFEPFESDTINDDFILPMRIIAKGYKGIYASDVNALELEQSDQSLDSKRRKRIAAGNLQQALRLRGILRPRFGALAFSFISGKVLRVLMPWLMLLAWFSSLWLWFDLEHWIFMLLALGQTAVYALALITHLGWLGGRCALCKTVHYLVSGHMSGLLGSINYFVNRYSRSYQRIF